MGIYDSYRLCSPLIEQAVNSTRQVHYRKSKPCKIYIDGLSVWFLAFTNNAPDRANAHQKLDDILRDIRKGNYFDIKSVTVYFNGRYPALKCKPISQHVQSQEVHLWCNELLNHGIVDNVKFLNVGESESECFFKRDKRFASVIVTNDSDILPICYKYNRKFENDTVFCYLTHKDIFFDTNFLSTKLNKNAFTLLLLLRGSQNIIEPLFSFTMVDLIFDLLLHGIPFYNKHLKKINSIMREVNEDNIEKCIVYFIWLIVDAKNSMGTFKWPSPASVMETDNYLEVIEWLIMYSKYGKTIYNYNKNFKLSGCYERKFHFILRSCGNVFSIFRNYRVEKFKEIEILMGRISSNEIIGI